MSSPKEAFTIGVEEEYQIVDPILRELSSSEAPILAKAEQRLGEQVQPELQLSQIEIATPVCRTLTEVRTEVARARREVLFLHSNSLSSYWPLGSESTFSCEGLPLFY